MSTTQLATIPETAPESALVAFTAPEGLDPFIEEVRNIVESFEHDLSTSAGRKKTASLSAKVSKFKVSLDNMGKGLTEEWKQNCKVVDASRKKMRDQLDELRDQAREPLTAWENAEEMRIQEIKDRLAFINKSIPEGTIDDMKETLMNLESATIDESFEEYEPAAKMAKERNLNLLKEAIDREEKAEADRQELERLRKAEADRLEAERIAKAKADEEAKAKADAEAKAKEEERIRKDAEEKARKEAEEKAQAEKAESERRELEARRKQEEAELRAQQAEAKAKADAEEEKRRIEKEEAERKANAEHNRKLKTESKLAMMAEGVSEEDAVKIIVAICANKIPHISMRF